MSHLRVHSHYYAVLKVVFGSLVWFQALQAQPQQSTNSTSTSNVQASPANGQLPVPTTVSFGVVTSNGVWTNQAGTAPLPVGILNVPSDVLVSLAQGNLAYLGILAKELKSSSATFASDVGGKLLLGEELWDAGLDQDRLHVVSAISEYAAGDLFPPAAVVESLVEAKLRLQLRQQGMGDDQIDQTVIGIKDLATQDALQLLPSNSGSGLTGNTDPLAVINSAVSQALNEVTGRSLTLVDPIDEFVTSGEGSPSNLPYCSSCPPYQESSSGWTSPNVPTAPNGLGPVNSGVQNFSNGIVVESQLIADSPEPIGISIQTQVVPNPSNVGIGVEVPSAPISVEISQAPNSPSTAVPSGASWPMGNSATGGGAHFDWASFGMNSLQLFSTFYGASHLATVSSAPAHGAKATGSQNRTPSNSNSFCGAGYYLNPNFLAGLPWTSGQSVCIANGTKQPYTGQIFQVTKQAGQPAPQTQESTGTGPWKDPCQAEADAAFAAPTIGAFLYLMTQYGACAKAHGY
jgi:hypothetical protein